MKKIAIIIPGNPPISYFYKKWENELCEEGTFHEVKTLPLPKSLNLKNELDYFTKILEHYKKQIKSQSLKGEVTLIGHSIGGFFALSLMKELYKEVNQCMLIFPFLGDPSSYGKFVLKAAKKLEPKEQFFKKITPYVKPGIDLLNKNLTDEIAGAIKLAWREKCYFSNHKGDNDFTLPDLDLTTYPLVALNKLNLIYNKHDDWCSKRTVSFLKGHFNSHFVDASHAFITNSKERRRVEKVITQIHSNQAYA